ncbi:hypothetical protein CALCODRAFT_495976 [Calocera cornea HHB12733]|uniref:Uncharacterized protein n=1 Tax=Calocera cornea HHB12733 TaxID=1353952 RepID=A0A165G4B8_9BASI|nr:hypothetical protein CALCODRAFT_495976 [Calocera cornea HHB12733]
MRTSNSAGSLDRRADDAADASDASNGWTLWFSEDGGMMMLPMVGELDEGDEGDATESSPSATPTTAPVPTSTSATLTTEPLSTSSRTPSSSSSSSSSSTSSPSAATSSALSSTSSLPHSALPTLIVLLSLAALCTSVWLLTRFCRSRRRRACELEEGAGDGYYPFGAEFGFFKGWSRPATPSLKCGRPGRAESEKSASPVLELPEQARTLSRELSEKHPGMLLHKRLSDGPYPTTLRLPDGYTADDPFSAPAPSPLPAPARTKLTVANLTSRDVSVAGTPSPLASPLPVGLFKSTPRSPWSAQGDVFRSPAVVVSSPTAASDTSLPAAAPAQADGWNSFKASVSSAISSFSSPFSRPSQVHLPDSFTRAVRRSHSVLTTSSDGSIRRARALDRAQMARVISLDREALRRQASPAPTPTHMPMPVPTPSPRMEIAQLQRFPSPSGMPSPHISTPNPFDDEVIRFGSPLSEGGLSRSCSQRSRREGRERLGPRRMPTSSSTYSRASSR